MPIGTPFDLSTPFDRLRDRAQGDASSGTFLPLSSLSLSKRTPMSPPAFDKLRGGEG